MRWLKLNRMAITGVVFFILAPDLSAQEPPPIPAPVAACAAAIECGLSAEAIIVADCGAATSSLLSRIESAIDLRTLLASQHAVLDAAQVHYEDLMRQVTVEGTELADDQESARAAKIAAAAALGATRVQVFELATQGMSEAALQKLANWRTSVAVQVPAAYRAHAATEAQWREIEGALRSESRAQRRDEQPSIEVSNLLASVRADVDVITAATRLEQQLTSVQAAFAACDPAQP